MYVASLDGGEARRILPGTDLSAAYAAPGYLFTASQGSLTIRQFDPAQGTASAESVPLAQSIGYDPATYRAGFSVSAGGVLAYRSGGVGTRQLVWFDRTGRQLRTLGMPDGAALTTPQLAPDGQRAAVFRAVAGNFDLWLVDLVRENWSRFTFDAAIDVTPVWSPDGRRIVFASNRNGSYHLFEKPTDGSADERPLLTTPTNKQPRDWSSDGRFLLYTQQDPKTASDLWALRVEGDGQPFPVVQTPFDEVHGQFSPEGRWVAYASNETGRYEIYVRPFPEGGGRWQVSTVGGIYPRWRRDGAELFYVAPDNTLMAVPVRGASDGRTFSPGSPVALFQTRLATGANVGVGGFASAPQYAVAADGRFLINVVASEVAVSPITLILNWTALLPD